MTRELGARPVALIIATLVFMQLLDGAIIATSLPVMAADFGVPTLSMSLGITSYLLAAAAFIPMSAWLAERLGAVKVFLGAIVVFTIASLGCALAQDLTQFICARVAQGVGGAFMLPVGRAIVLSKAQKHEVVDVLAAMIWPALAAPVVGPVLGGAVTTYLSWRYNFLINIPIGMVGFVLVWRLIRDQGPRVKRPFDWLGFGLSAVGLVGLLAGLEMFVQGEGHPAVALSLTGLGLVACILAVWHLLRTDNPLISLAPFEVPTFLLSTVGAGSYFRIGIDAMPFLLPLLLQLGMGLDPLEAGSLMFAYFIGNLAMKAVTTPIMRRFGMRAVLLANGLFSVVLMGLCAFVLPTVPVWAIVVILAASGLSRSMQFTTLSSLSFADIGPKDRGAASSLIAVVQQLVLVLAVALATLVVKLSQSWRGDHLTSLADLQLAIAAMAALAIVSTLLLLRLDRSAGEELTRKVGAEGLPARSP